MEREKRHGTERESGLWNGKGGDGMRWVWYMVGVRRAGVGVGCVDKGYRSIEQP